LIGTTHINKINKKKKKNTIGKVPKSNRKIIERGRIDTPNIQIHDRLLSWLGTGTSVNNNIF
jgi:hypothetical protein